MDLIERLRQKARSSAEASQMLARAKSERNQAAGDVGANYEGGTPEQMIEWKAANEIERLRYAARGGNAEKTTADLIEFLADRLVSVHGESRDVDYIRVCRERASMLRNAV